MSQNFEVTQVDPRDLDGISRLLQQRSMKPSDELWQEYCGALSQSSLTSPQGDSDERETSVVITDKIGVVRGFCIVRRRPSQLWSAA